MSGCNPMRKVPNIQRVTAQARKTFLMEAESACSPCDQDRRMSCEDRDAEFRSRLCELFKMVSCLTAQDLGLDECLAAKYSDRRPRSGPQGIVAPVTYVEVFENECMSVGVFVMRPGARIPLHNHPKMHGIVKCLMGDLKVTAYHKMDKTDAEKQCVPAAIARDPNGRAYLDRSLIFPAKKKVKAHFGPDDGVSYLSEDAWNYHEIEAVRCEGPSAFLDILARPHNSNKAYRADRNEDCDPCQTERRQNCGQKCEQTEEPEARDCHYFHEITGDCEKGWLQHIPVPQDFYCNIRDYRGPNPFYQC